MVLSYRSVEGLTWVVLRLSSHYVKLSDNFVFWRRTLSEFYVLSVGGTGAKCKRWGHGCLFQNYTHGHGCLCQPSCMKPHTSRIEPRPEGASSTVGTIVVHSLFLGAPRNFWRVIASSNCELQRMSWKSREYQSHMISTPTPIAGNLWENLCL